MIELQTQLTFQEDTIQQLNEVVTQQQKDIERLQLQMEALKGLIQGYVQEQHNVKDDVPPPHY